MKSFKILKFFMALFAIAVTFAAIGLGAFEGALAITMTAPLILANYETSNDAKQKRAQIWDKMNEMIQLRKSEKRDWSRDEQKIYDNHRSNFDQLTEHIKNLASDEERSLIMAGKKAEGMLRNNNENAGRSEFFDSKTQRAVPVFRGNQKFTDHFPNDERLSFGNAVKGLITGDWRGAENERQLSTGSNNGLLVPMSVMATVWDMARAKSVAARAGAQFVTMEDGRISLVRIGDLDGFEAKTQNEAFTGGTVTFDPVLLQAYTLGTTITMSRELAEDGLNVARAIEQTLSAGVADFLDKMIFTGSGDGQPLGLLNDSDINTVSADGSVSFAHLLRAWSLAKSKNADTLSIVSSADLQAQFANLFVDGSGFFTAPSLLDQLSWYGTSNILVPEDIDSSGNTQGMIIGDFSKLLIGVRQNALVEVTNQGGDSFKKHQAIVKVTMRVDFTPVYPGQFSRIIGIEAPENWWEESAYPVIGDVEIDDTDS